MSVSVQSIMQRLREETTPHHKFAESRPLEQAMVQGRLPKAHYVKVLGQRYLVHRELEASLRSLRDADPALARVIREDLFQESNLRDDLEFFGVDPDSVQPHQPTLRLLHSIRETATAQPRALLGFYYVFEGSKNGARYIAKALLPQYGIRGGPGGRYLDPHGESQRELWTGFKQDMDAIAFSEPERDAMVAAAKHTFKAIGELDDELHAG